MPYPALAQYSKRNIFQEFLCSKSLIAREDDARHQNQVIELSHGFYIRASGQLNSAEFAQPLKPCGSE